MSIKGVVPAGWSQHYDVTLRSTGAVLELFDTSAALEARFAADWSPPDVMIVDLALVTPRLREQTDRSRVIAFGNPDYAASALAARAAEFIDIAPTDAALSAALDAVMAVDVAAGVADLSDRAGARLNQIGAEASRLAAALARLAPVTAPPPPIDAVRVRTIIDARRARDRFFPGEVFGEPAWDMLLDLAVAAAEQRDVAVSSLCIAAAVPTTTALRWVRMLCDLGLFDRRDDPADARRSFISLGAAAATAMARYLAQTQPA